MFICVKHSGYLENPYKNFSKCEAHFDCFKNLDLLSGSIIEAIKNADMLIVGGTSLVVYPTAGLIDYYDGNRLVLINEQKTPYDNKVDLIITDKIGEVFSKV